MPIFDRLLHSKLQIFYSVLIGDLLSSNCPIAAVRIHSKTLQEESVAAYEGEHEPCVLANRMLTVSSTDAWGV